MPHSIKIGQGAVHVLGVNKRRPHHPFRSLTADGRNHLSWVDNAEQPHTRLVSKRLGDLDLFSGVLTRQPGRYHDRRHFEGFYWCAATGRHVWHESMTEYYALMLLDHTLPIKKVAAQPLHLLFADGAHHYPDFLLELDNTQRVLIDVRPSARITQPVAEAFKKTGQIAEQIGWNYLVVHDLDRIRRHNLEVIGGYRHPRYQPPPQLTETITELTAHPISLGELVGRVGPRRAGAYIHYIYHLIWNRTLQFNTSQPLTLNTTLRTTQ